MIMRTLTILARSDAAPATVRAALAVSETATTRVVTFRGREVNLFADQQQFSYGWEVRPAVGGCEVTLTAEYAIGVPIWDRIIEPLLAPAVTDSLLADVPGTVTVLEKT